MNQALQNSSKKEEQKRPRRIIIHLGLPKTGTTTIQEFFSINKTSLKQFIAVSPKDNLTKSTRKWALRSARWRGVPRWIARTGYNIALKQLVSKVKTLDFNTLVISDETLVGFQAKNLLSKDISCIIANTKCLVKAFSEFQVEYVAYTRENPAWMRSLYNQDFKRRRTVLSYTQWLSNYPENNSAIKVIKSLENALGANKLHVFSMESEISSGLRLGGSILRLAGLDDQYIMSLIMPELKNQSLPDSAIKLLRKFHSNPIFKGIVYRILAKIVIATPELFASDLSKEKPPSA